MSPRGKRGELPKTAIRPGAVGYLPLNPLTVSYLAQGYGDTILGFLDKPETLALKTKSALTVQDAKKPRELSLVGCFFNSYADALYRGRLPQVIIAAPSSEDMPVFLDDFVEYIEKMMSLGFFVPKKEIIKKDPVNELVPCFVLCGSGMLFSRFITGLMRTLRQMESRYPLLDELTRTRIIGRFTRGLPQTDRAGTPAPFDEAHLSIESISHGPLIEIPLEIPRSFRIAGGSAPVQEMIRAALTGQGLTVHIENRVANAPERLEFENALWRLSNVVLPSLAQASEQAQQPNASGSSQRTNASVSGQQAKSSKSKSKAKASNPDLSEQSPPISLAPADASLSQDTLALLAPQVEAGILAIGRLRKAFGEHENPASIFGNRPGGKDKRFVSKPAAKDSKNAWMPQQDSHILLELSQYAEILGLPAEKALFQSLAERVQQMETLAEA